MAWENKFGNYETWKIHLSDFDGFLNDIYEHSSNVRGFPQDFLTNFSWFSCDFLRFFRIFPWSSHDFLLIFHDLPMIFPWFSWISPSFRTFPWGQTSPHGIPPPWSRSQAPTLRLCPICRRRWCYWGAALFDDRISNDMSILLYRYETGLLYCQCIVISLIVNIVQYWYMMTGLLYWD